MSIDLGDVVRVVAEWDGPGGMLAQMVYHLRAKVGTSEAATVVAAAVLAAHQAAWLNIDNDLDSELLATVQEMLQWDFVLNRWDGVDTRPFTALDGLTVGDLQAHGVAGLVKVFTATARRQARKYIPGYIETVVGNGVLTGPALTNLALYAAALDNDVVGGTMTMEFGTFNTDPASPLFETFSAATGSVQAEGVVAYQRRRKPGTGI